MNLPDVRRVRRFLEKDNAVEGLQKLLTWLTAQEESMIEADKDPLNEFSIFRVDFGNPDGHDWHEVFGIGVTKDWFIWQDVDGRWSVSNRTHGMKALTAGTQEFATTICKRLQALCVDWSLESLTDLVKEKDYQLAGKFIRSLKTGTPLNEIRLETDCVVDETGVQDDGKGSSAKSRIRTLRLRKKKVPMEVHRAKQDV